MESYYGEDSIVIFPMMLSIDEIQVVKEIYYFHRQRANGKISPYIRDEEYISKYYNAKEVVIYLRKIGVKQEKIVWHSVRVNHRKFDEIFSDPIESIGD